MCIMYPCLFLTNILAWLAKQLQTPWNALSSGEFSPSKKTLSFARSVARCQTNFPVSERFFRGLRVFLVVPSLNGFSLEDLFVKKKEGIWNQTEKKRQNIFIYISFSVKPKHSLVVQFFKIFCSRMHFIQSSMLLKSF